MVVILTVVETVLVVVVFPVDVSIQVVLFAEPASASSDTISIAALLVEVITEIPLVVVFAIPWRIGPSSCW